MRNRHHRHRGSHPVPGHVDDAEEYCQAAQGDTHVDEEWPGANRDQRSCEGVLDSHSSSSLAAASSSSASGSTNRRREASKSNNSAYRPHVIAVSICRWLSSWLNCSSII